MATYKTAMGKVVDMSALASKNEFTRAVGNMGVNARGDKIDTAGRIIKPVTETVTDMYSRTVGNKSAQARGQEIKPDVPKPAIDLSQLNEIEQELESNIEDDLEVEKIKAAEINSLKAKK